jgi:uncharacterized protein YecT (DUF1311 family)
MRIASAAVAVATVLLTFRPALAQAPLPCGDVTGAALTSCLAKQYADADRQMSDAYKAALVRVGASAIGRNLVMDWKRALQETQRKWMSYREADCGPPIAYETAKNPDQREVAQLRCRIGHTAERLRRLTASTPE